MCVPEGASDVFGIRGLSDNGSTAYVRVGPRTFVVGCVEREMSQHEHLHTGEWRGAHRVVYFLSATRLALEIISASGKRTVEADYVASADVLEISEPAPAADRTFRIDTWTSRALALEAADGTKHELLPVGDEDDEGDETLPHDMSGADLGMDLCVVGQKLDAKQAAALDAEDPVPEDSDS